MSLVPVILTRTASVRIETYHKDILLGNFVVVSGVKLLIVAALSPLPLLMTNSSSMLSRIFLSDVY